MIDSKTQEFLGTGRRKTAIARIRMAPGNGKISVNGRAFENYFLTEVLRMQATQPLTVTAAFALNTYTLTPSAGPGGSITPNSVQTVTYGGGAVFTIAPNTGYHITGVYVDGSAVGAVSVYTFTNVTANHTISAAFALSCQAVTGAAFTFAPLQPLIGQAVWFTGTVAAGSGPLTYTWAWGDGSAAGLGAPLSHAFPLTATQQTYTVTMAVSNACSGPVHVAQTLTVTPRQLFLPLLTRLR